ncbi:hypothetical protein [Streptomyces sp. NPDC003247]|uniref:hypothetical protein n=1 Tax=Streptomyces sp. NPDC003247 TaxID=3364677 RepID=UPI0036BC5F67
MTAFVARWFVDRGLLVDLSANPDGTLQPSRAATATGRASKRCVPGVVRAGAGCSVTSGDRWPFSTARRYSQSASGYASTDAVV